VNAWGIPYIAAMAGARLIMPGPKLDGESLMNLINDEKVNVAFGVPTIWMGLLQALRSSGGKLPLLQRTFVGGTALPPSMIDAFREEYGVELIHAWGMTETAPVATLNKLLHKHLDLPQDEQRRLRHGQGRPLFGVELRVTDSETGRLQPNDGESQGNLQIRGHWIVESYYGTAENALTEDGWFDTGDIATLDPDGYMVIRDRAKDIIKSGGEWIST